jgi:hypothetical protein
MAKNLRTQFFVGGSSGGNGFEAGVPTSHFTFGFRRLAKYQLIG